MKKTGGDKINYQKYSWDITNIINEINKKYSPMYMINLHIVHINGLLKDVDERNIDDNLRPICGNLRKRKMKLKEIK